MLEQSLTNNQSTRQPAITAVLSLGAGILLDSLAPQNLSVWLWGALICSVISVLFYRRWMTRWVTLLLIGALMCIGAARHHSFSSMRQVNNVVAFATENSSPIKLKGVIVQEIEIENAEHGPRIPSWMEVDRSICTIRCSAVNDAGEWRPVSGRVRADVTGHLVHLQIGDEVQLLGHLSKPRPPRNPGALDYREFLRHQGIDALLSVDHPAAVSLVTPGSNVWWCIPRFRQTLREECRLLFMLHLTPASRSLAASILLGDRTRLTEDIRSSFIESGTMHLLAISGLHVGILVWLILKCSQAINLSSFSTTLLIISVVICYAVLTNHRPPVIRAAMLATISLFGYSCYRSSLGFNTLAICASLLLLWRPTDLFDIGAQLSFIAVGAILWSLSWKLNRHLPRQENVLQPERSEFGQIFSPLVSWLSSGYLLTGTIWFCTLPLTIYWFHLVAPVGFLINVVLIPLVISSLSLGYLFLCVGFILPGISHFVGGVFDLSLQWLLYSVEFAQNMPLSHFYLPSLPLWWMSGFYALLAVVWQLVGNKRTAYLASRGILLWTALGLVVGLPKPTSPNLRCTFLSVGHGLAVVIELPGQETLLFDAGTLGDGRRARRIVERYLWTRNRNRIDGIIVSHADHDHFNGVFGLMDVVPIQSLYISQQFLDFGQITVSDLCEAASQHQIPIHLIAADDQLAMKYSPQVTFRILHPAREFASTSDNANSLVLEILFANKKILLTGDLEKDGLQELMKQPSGTWDIFMVPHHGSKHSVSPKLFEWAAASHYVVSTNDLQVTQRLTSLVPDFAKVLSTGKSGAITYEITPQGEIFVSEVLE